MEQKDLDMLAELVIRMAAVTAYYIVRRPDQTMTLIRDEGNMVWTEIKERG